MDEVAVLVEKLRPTRGDVIVVHLLNHLPASRAAEITAQISRVLPSGVLGLVLGPGQTIETIDDETATRLIEARARQMLSE